jgi:ABC-type glutathione transport system ATPase component
MASTNVKLAVENVSKTFRVRGGRSGDDQLLPVLRRVSFDVNEGEIVSLIGESGCSKTTLLRIIQVSSVAMPGRSASTASRLPAPAATAGSCSSRRTCCHGDHRRARRSADL